MIRIIGDEKNCLEGDDPMWTNLLDKRRRRRCLEFRHNTKQIIVLSSQTLCLTNSQGYTVLKFQLWLISLL